MKKPVFFFCFMCFCTCIFGQNFSLTHTGTQYDAFENPVQQGFVKDFSRKYAVNLLPSLFLSGNFEGDAQSVFKKYVFTRKFGAGTFGVFTDNNQLDFNANLYLFTYRIFKTTNYNRELGFSLKFTDEGNSTISNGTFALLSDYRTFNKSTVYSNVLNSAGFNQSYWQLGLNYRENYNEKWGFGGKFSVLNGASYSKIGIEESNLKINSETSYTAGLKGTYVSSFGRDSFTYQKLLPNFKNYGLAISAGASYTSKKGQYITFNVKDLGFIRWSKKTSTYNFDDNFTVDSANRPGANARFFSKFENTLNGTETNKAFYAAIDTKITLAASQTFSFYTPTFIFNKSVFNRSGQIAIVNSFKKNAFNISINPNYDFLSKFNLGSQLLIKSPNAEFYLGSEQIFPTYYFAKGFLKKDENIGNSNPRAVFYLGLSMKFGKKMQDMGNADEIPGLNDKETGYVVRLGKKELKRVQKQNRAIEKRRRKSDKRNRKN